MIITPTPNRGMVPESEPGARVVGTASRQLGFHLHRSTADRLIQFQRMAQSDGQRTSRNEIAAMIVTGVHNYPITRIYRELDASRNSADWQDGRARVGLGFVWPMATIAILRTAGQDLAMVGQHTTRTELTDALISNAPLTQETIGEALRAFRMTTLGDIFPEMLQFAAEDAIVPNQA